MQRLNQSEKIPKSFSFSFYTMHVHAKVQKNNVNKYK